MYNIKNERYKAFKATQTDDNDVNAIFYKCDEMRLIAKWELGMKIK
jgi:hypothetical protein